MGSVGTAMPVTPADSNAASEMETEDKTTTPLPDSYWAKYNVKVEKPQYTNEQYEARLKSEHWSKEETDYLVDLAYEFDLRWIIIGDRYEYHPKEAAREDVDSMAITPQAPTRTLEDMKARYYDVAAKTMLLRHPLSSMSSSEFDAHEKMTRFDPVRESQRKKYAEQLMQRTEEEKHEEELLLKELSRIVNNQERLFNERKALYDRLEPAASTSRENFSMSIYQSSAGLTQLMQNLLAQNKSKELEKKEKRRSVIEAGEIPGSTERNHRQSVSGTDKRNSLTGESGRRQLTAREETKYGVSHPTERLTGGVQFRHERITKSLQAKSAAQSTRITDALTHLGVATKLIMPTTKVVTGFENLVEKIKILLEARRYIEKVDGEIKVSKHSKLQREAKDRGEEVKEEEGEQENQKGEVKGDAEEEEEEETSKADVMQEDESKVEEEEDNGDEGSEDGEDEEDEAKNEAEAEAENASESEAEAEAQDQEEIDDDDDDEDSEDDSEDEAEDQPNTNAEADENAIADEMRDLQEDQDGEAEEQEHVPNGDPDVEGDDVTSSVAASPAPTMKSEGMRKRSASVISHLSNRSSKRQRK